MKAYKYSHVKRLGKSLSCFVIFTKQTKNIEIYIKKDIEKLLIQNGPNEVSSSKLYFHN